MTNKKKQLETGKDGLQAEIIALLKAKRLWHWRAYNGATMRGGGAGGMILTPTQNPGMPDIIGAFPGGRIFMIEVKRPGWKPPNPPKTLRICKTYQRYCLQKMWLETCNDNGGVGFFATSLETVQTVLDNLFPQGIK